MTTQELIKDAIGKAFNTLKKKSAIYSNGKEIPANANLNSYMTEGVYYSPNGTRTATLSNAPFTDAGFKLIVMKAGYSGASYMMQVLVCGAHRTNDTITNAVYMRQYYSGWLNWAKVYLLDADTLSGYYTTYQGLYDKLTNLPSGRPAVFHMSTDVANAISNNRIAGTFRGVVSRTSGDSFDFIGMSGAGGSIWTIRATLAASGATVSNIQRMVMPSTSSPLVKRISYTYAYSSLAAGATLNITANDFGISVPSGYSQIGISGMYTGNNNVVVRNAVYATGTNTAMSIRNVSSSAASGTAGLGYIYIRSEAVSG